jgi:hypothetical protein
VPLAQQVTDLGVPLQVAIVTASVATFWPLAKERLLARVGAGVCLEVSGPIRFVVAPWELACNSC